MALNLSQSCVVRDHQPLKTCIAMFQTFREYSNTLRTNIVLLQIQHFQSTVKHERVCQMLCSLIANMVVPQT
ncbi:hypothetical protein ACHAW5_001506 [Stephanodiscus triporus]|uniref:Uncharacterized protein n=1 Tax=Stephanodiscus triporus TaxID=2934178 RepID=A0ABD3NUY2_9STRA